MTDCQYHPLSKGRERAAFKVTGTIAGRGTVRIRRYVCRGCLVEAVKLLVPREAGIRMTVTAPVGEPLPEQPSPSQEAP
jgi:hypothetical protein